MSTKPHLYVNSRGFEVTRHSYSGGDSFNFCARKYYLERVQGWQEKQERAATKFGIALEHAITFWHQRGMDTLAAVEDFKQCWAEHKDKEYIYSKPEKDWASMELTGCELVRLYAVKYPTFPYIVTNPNDNFQVNENFEVFPGSKLAGIEFTAYIDLMANDKESGAPIIIDIKTSGKDIPELLVLDPQLRSYSWVKNTPMVAFLWFRKMGREISKGDKATMLECYAGLVPGDEVIVMMNDEVSGIWVTKDEKLVDAMNVRFVGKSKAVEAARQEYIETNGKLVTESSLTKQRVQFKMARITKESADDIGRKIKKDVIDIARANETGYWSMNSGVRFPNERCPSCPMRGICSDQIDLRDQLVERKQLDDFDFMGDNGE